MADQKDKDWRQIEALLEKQLATADDSQKPQIVELLSTIRRLSPPGNCPPSQIALPPADLDLESLARSIFSAAPDSLPQPASRAPITDRIDVEELGRAHEAIRGRKSTRNRIAAAAGVIVAFGLLGVAYVEMARRSSSHSASPAPQQPVGVVASNLPRLTTPARQPLPSLSVEDPPKVVEGNNAEEPEIQIRPAVRRIAGSNVHVPRAPARAKRIEPRVAKAAPVIHRRVQAERKQTALAAHTNTKTEKKTPVRVALRQEQRRPIRVTSSASHASRVVQPTSMAARQPKQLTRPPDVSYTPMRKETLLADARRVSAPLPLAADREDMRARDPVFRRNFDDEHLSQPYLASLDDTPKRARGRVADRRDSVKRRICLETGWLAGDLCPRTAQVIMPESRVPTRVCRVHVLP